MDGLSMMELNELEKLTAVLRKVENLLYEKKYTDEDKVHLACVYLMDARNAKSYHHFHNIRSRSD